MLTSIKTSNNASPLSALLPPTAVQAVAPETHAGQPSFAKLLHEQQAPAPVAAPVAERAHAPAQAPASAPAHKADKPAAEAHAPAPAQSPSAHTAPAGAARPANAAREPAQARDAARPAAKSTGAHDDGASPAAVGDPADGTDDSGTTPVATDPALADWLAGLNLPGPAAAAVPLPTPLPAPAADTGIPAPRADALAVATNAAPLTAATPTSDAAQAAATTAAGSAAIVLAGNTMPSLTTATTGRSEANGLAAATGSPRTPTDTGARSAARDSNDTSLLAVATKADAPSGQLGNGAANSGDAGTPDRGAQAPVWAPLSSIASALPAPATFMPAVTNNLAAQTTSNAAQPLAVNLPTPLYSPEFPQAMGAQLTVLAQGGVEHAELHLNPAEMGPVSVQIVMEGTQARIDFGADTASTRQAIEASLPELASALRDAGLTLSGGGVSQHSRSRQEMADAQGTPAGGRGNGGSSGAEGGTNSDAAPTPLRRSVRLGGVDAYA